MNLEKLISLIETEEARLSLALSQDNLDVKKIEKVITENNFSTVKGLLNINTVDVMSAYLCIYSKRYRFDEIHTRLEKNIALISLHARSLFEKLFMIMSSPFSTSLIEKELARFSGGVLKFDYKALKELYVDNDVDLYNIFVIMQVIDSMKYDNDSIKEFAEIFGGRAKNRKKALDKTLKEKYRVDKLTEELQEIATYYQKIKTIDKEEKKKIKTELGNYAEVKQLLVKGKTYDINKLLSLIKSDEIKKELLCQFNVVQRQEFDVLYDEYSSLSLDNKLEVQAIFKDYGFDFNSISAIGMNRIMLLEHDDLKLMLDKIKSLNIVDTKLVEYILLNSSSEVLDSINSLIKDDIITLEFVISNRSVLSLNTLEKNNYFKLKEMLELWKNLGINSRIFITDLDVYFYDSNIVKTNIDILKSYNLFISLKSAKKFDFLSDDNLARKIDILLELGYEKLLEENLELLSRSISKIEKLYILKNMNLLPVDMDSLIKVLDDEKFLAFVDNSYDYIFNAVDYHVDKNLVSKVETFNVDSLATGDNNTSRVISVGNVLFSKNRIRRNRQILDNFDLSEEEKQINAILIGSILSEEEYKSVISDIMANTKVIKL